MSNKPFPNTATSALVSAGETKNIKIFNQTSGNSSNTIDLSDEVLADWEKDDDIYIRVMFQDTNCYAVVTCQMLNLL